MDELKSKYLQENHIREIDPEYKYFKIFGMTTMFYTEEYFESRTIEELKAKDKENADYFSSQQR